MAVCPQMRSRNLPDVTIHKRVFACRGLFFYHLIRFTDVCVRYFVQRVVVSNSSCDSMAITTVYLSRFFVVTDVSSEGVCYIYIVGVLTWYATSFLQPGRRW